MAGLMSAGTGTIVYKIASNLNFINYTTIDVKSKISSYSRLTKDDFIVCLNGGRSGNYGEVSGRVIWAGYTPVEKAYNSNTGILTLTGYGPSIMYAGGYYTPGNAIVDVYVIQKIKDLST